MWNTPQYDAMQVSAVHLVHRRDVAVEAIGATMTQHVGGEGSIPPLHHLQAYALEHPPSVTRVSVHQANDAPGLDAFPWWQKLLREQGALPCLHECLAVAHPIRCVELLLRHIAPVVLAHLRCRPSHRRHGRQLNSYCAGICNNSAQLNRNPPPPSQLANSEHDLKWTLSSTPLPSPSNKLQWTQHPFSTSQNTSENGLPTPLCFPTS